MATGEPSLRERARKLQIYGWEDMTPAQLEAAIRTAEEEAGDADDPLKRTVRADGAGQGMGQGSMGQGSVAEEGGMMGAANETFVCDRCGNEFPRNRLKEVVSDDGSKLRLCPSCLDKLMNAADEVRGGPGDEKQAAAYVDEAADQATYGVRE